MMETVRAIAAQDYDKLFSMIDAVVQSSKDIAIFWQDLIGLYREMLVLRTAKDAAAYLDLTDSELVAMQEVAKPFKSSTLLYHCTLLEQALLSMQRANAIKRIVAESTLVRMCDPELQTSPEALLARIAALEDKITFGQVAVTAPASTPVGADSISARETTPVGAIHESPAPNASPTQSMPVGSIHESTAPPAPTAPRIPKLKKTEPAGEKRTLRPLRVWAQVLDKMTKANPLAAGFYYAAKAYSDEGGNVVLKFASDFDIQMAQSYNAVPTLCSILSGLLNANVTPAQVKYECEGQSGAQNSVIDEILESAQDN
jgi:DNA polymerase-3 subunit gamma/tau